MKNLLLEKPVIGNYSTHEMKGYSLHSTHTLSELQTYLTLDTMLYKIHRSVSSILLRQNVKSSNLRQLEHALSSCQSLLDAISQWGENGRPLLPTCTPWYRSPRTHTQYKPFIGKDSRSWGTTLTQSGTTGGSTRKSRWSREKKGKHQGEAGEGTAWG
jgi:hypothetical protein